MKGAWRFWAKGADYNLPLLFSAKLFHFVHYVGICSISKVFQTNSNGSAKIERGIVFVSPCHNCDIFHFYELRECFGGYPKPFQGMTKPTIEWAPYMAIKLGPFYGWFCYTNIFVESSSHVRFYPFLCGSWLLLKHQNKYLPGSRKQRLSAFETS